MTLYAAGTGDPKQLAQGKTNGDGVFKLDAGQAHGRERALHSRQRRYSNGR